jgi:hypothetical protein
VTVIGRWIRHWITIGVPVVVDNGALRVIDNGAPGASRPTMIRPNISCLSFTQNVMKYAPSLL